MNWRQKLEGKEITDPKKLTPGTNLLLIVGKDKSWMPGAWIVGKQYKFFKFVEYNGNGARLITVAAPDRNAEWHGEVNWFRIVD